MGKLLLWIVTSAFPYSPVEIIIIYFLTEQDMTQCSWMALDIQATKKKKKEKPTDQ